MPIDYTKAVRCACFSKDVYQSFSNIRFVDYSNQPILINEEKTDTQCAILPDDSGVVIVFRGSESQFDWDTNYEYQQDQAEFDRKIVQGKIVAAQEQIYPYTGESSSGAKMHRGFIRAYFSVRDKIHEYVTTHSVSRVTVTGHSLGGALATLCAVDLQYNFSDTLTAIEIYTFGAPKVGNDGFRDSFNRRVPESYRIVHGMDLVPEVPRWWQGYRSVDKEVRIGRRFSFNFFSQRFKDHAIDQYINALKEKAQQQQPSFTPTTV